MTDDEPVDVLLVEDNAGDAYLVEEAFDEGPVDVTLHIAPDGASALDFLHRRGDYTGAPRPKAVLLDLNLPCKNGDEVLEEVEAVPDLKRIPFVVLTSSESERELVDCYDHHANACVTKPTDPFEFTEMIHRFATFWFSTARLPDCRK